MTCPYALPELPLTYFIFTISQQKLQLKTKFIFEMPLLFTIYIISKTMIKDQPKVKGECIRKTTKYKHETSN